MTDAATLTADATADLQAGELDSAIEGFVRSAEAHATGGDSSAASIGFRLASVVASLVGRLEEAAALAERALDHATDPRLRFAALVGVAEVHRQRDRPVDAVARLTEAVELADALADAGTPAASVLEVGALLRRRAGIHHAMGRTDAAVADLQRAAHELVTAGEVGSAAATELELYGAVQETSSEGALAALRAARAHAVASGDVAVRAQVDAVEAAEALAAGDLATSRAHFLAARDGALESVDAATYLAAVSGLAAVTERLGDRVAAYAVLASAWVTVADLLGREVAVAAIKPQLAAQHERWGATAFAAVKEAYESARRGGSVAG